MVNYNKNKLINECLDAYYETFGHTLDTADYVPKKYTKAILKYIFKNMRKAFKRVDKEDKLYQRVLKESARVEALAKKDREGKNNGKEERW